MSSLFNNKNHLSSDNIVDIKTINPSERTIID